MQAVYLYYILSTLSNREYPLINPQVFKYTTITWNSDYINISLTRFSKLETLRRIGANRFSLIVAIPCFVRVDLVPIMRM